jgi:lipopolysaccharide transport system permease protein
MDAKTVNNTPRIVIRPYKSLFNIGFKELWDYRELALFFVWRDLKVRYKQTFVGVMWVMFQPLMTMVIFTVFFGRLAKIPSNGIPYPIFVYIGLLLWNYFSFSLSHASNSMIENSNIIQKVYFPRLIIPISSSIVGLVDFMVASIVLGGIMIAYKYVPSYKWIVFMPILVFITFLLSVGLGSFLASINVKYRDVRYALPFFIQILMFVTPVIYPISILNAKYHWIMALNPMSGVIETARSAILGIGHIDYPFLALSLAIGLIVFACGILYFRKTERFFADII